MAPYLEHVCQWSDRDARQPHSYFIIFIIIIIII
jgi:hypothetical protein